MLMVVKPTTLPANDLSSEYRFVTLDAIFPHKCCINLQGADLFACSGFQESVPSLTGPQVARKGISLVLRHES
jgi:hypothetical protein